VFDKCEKSCHLLWYMTSLFIIIKLRKPSTFHKRNLSNGTQTTFKELSPTSFWPRRGLHKHACKGQLTNTDILPLLKGKRSLLARQYMRINVLSLRIKWKKVQLRIKLLVFVETLKSATIFKQLCLVSFLFFPSRFAAPSTGRWSVEAVKTPISVFLL